LFETAASAGGTVDDVRFELDLPFTVNERDAISLVNVQNPTTIVTVNIDFNQLTDLLADATNYTLVGNLSVIPVIETFTIPLLKEAIPDMSVLKLVNEFDQSIPGAGDVTIKLSPGYTYRKVLLYFEDAAGVPFTDADLTDIFIRLNQADTPYKINPYALAAENHKRYGYPLDSGLYVLDWATIAGQVNLAGSRDFVDAERITEFWIQTNSNKSGKVTVVTETLARLAG
jgi:hypothetical protein